MATVDKKENPFKKPDHKWGFIGTLLRLGERFQYIEDKEYELMLRERQLKVIALDLMLKDHYQHLKVIDYLYSTAVK